MSSQVLYRKYRPQVFDEVIGQTEVVRALSSQIDNQAFAHAYLFFGSRGTGKTSIARIFGRTLGISSSDIYEIDAASNRGIDDIRSLREAVRTTPLESTHKLYIIDEVHMLTKEAFNALLKTLEEPPPHVIFILATTEIEKVPETIVSRCQVYTFSSPSVDTLTDHILDVAKKEGSTLNKEVAGLIALSGDGSFRDALGALQKVLTGIDSKKLEVLDVEKILRIPSSTHTVSFVKNLLEGKREEVFLIIDSVSSSGLDVSLFIKQVLVYMRLLLLARFDSASIKDEIRAHTHKKEIEEIIQSKPVLLQSKTLSRLITAYLESRSTIISTLPLELAVIEILEETK